MIRAVLIVLLLAGCTPARPVATTTHQIPQHWTAVLVAGDGSLPVFDNATGRLVSLLGAVGTPSADIHRFSAAPDILSKPHVQLASKTRVLEAIEAMHPQAGQACFVFLTSHGAHGRGLFLAAQHDFLTPEDLDGALEAGCGTAPTVAIVSGCYSGGFTQSPMARSNRIVLSAAAADRPSFGCGAGQEYTFYDECLLRSLGSLPKDWPEVIADTGQCVAKLEAQDREQPSQPQSAIGTAAAGLPVPG